MSCWPVAAYLAAARGAEPLELDELAEPDDAPEKADPDPAAAADEAGAAGAASPSPTPDDDELPGPPAATAATQCTKRPLLTPNWKHARRSSREQLAGDPRR